MNTEQHQITVSGVQVQIVRKAIKNLHLGVYPPHGRVRVAAPLAVSDEAVRLAVIGKLGWIKRQRGNFAAQERQSAREYISGESHYVWGSRYRLQVIAHDGPAQMILRNKTRMDLLIRPGCDIPQRERVLRAWYRKQLKQEAAPLIVKWEAIIDVKVAEWGVKRMKTKWGACNNEARRVWLNLELAKKPRRCLEYIIVHELVHLHERHHNDRFTAYMNTFLPQWRFYREELKKSPLGHATWEYCVKVKT